MENGASTFSGEVRRIVAEITGDISVKVIRNTTTRALSIICVTFIGNRELPPMKEALVTCFGDFSIGRPIPFKQLFLVNSDNLEFGFALLNYLGAQAKMDTSIKTYLKDRRDHLDFDYRALRQPFDTQFSYYVLGYSGSFDGFINTRLRSPKAMSSIYRSAGNLLKGLPLSDSPLIDSDTVYSEFVVLLSASGDHMAKISDLYQITVPNYYTAKCYLFGRYLVVIYGDSSGICHLPAISNAGIRTVILSVIIENYLLADYHHYKYL